MATTRSSRRTTSTRPVALAAHANRTREQDVIDAAVRVFAAHGYDAATMQQIADEVGMLKGSLYHWTDSKESLLARIFEECAHDVAAFFVSAAASDGPVVDRLERLLSSYAAWLLAHSARADVYEREWRHASDDLRATAESDRRRCASVLRDLVLEGQASGALDPHLDAAAAARFVLDSFAALPHLAGRGRAARVVEDTVALALRAVGGPTRATAVRTTATARLAG